ncbi:MAG: DsbA family protein [Candidatus Dormibacterales bacterium]
MDSVRVEKLEQQGSVRVTWLPFELHPDAPDEGIPSEQYFGPGRTARMREHLRGAAAQVGLNMQPRNVIINSRRALGAAEFARESGKFDDMHKALFQAHWEGTGKLEDIDDLVAIGTRMGLDPAALRAAVEENRYGPVIDENRRVATSVGIEAIPAHIFGRRFLIVGAQPMEVFEQVLDRLADIPMPD